MSIKTRFAFIFINIGVNLLPESFRERTFIHNCILTKKINVNGPCDCEGCARERSGKGGYQPCVKNKPTPPPNRIYKETFFGGLIETEDSKQATKQWREKNGK